MSDVPTNSETTVSSEVQGVSDEAASEQEIAPNEEDVLVPPEEEEEEEENKVSSDDLNAAYHNTLWYCPRDG